MFRGAPEAGEDQFANEQQFLGQPVVQFHKQLLVREQFLLPEESRSSMLVFPPLSVDAGGPLEPGNLQFCWASSRSLKRCTLPVAVLGSDSTK